MKKEPEPEKSTPAGKKQDMHPLSKLLLQMKELAKDREEHHEQALKNVGALYVGNPRLKIFATEEEMEAYLDMQQWSLEATLSEREKELIGWLMGKLVNLLAYHLTPEDKATIEREAGVNLGFVGGTAHPCLKITEETAK
jgi:hypothetical protein